MNLGILCLVKLFARLFRRLYSVQHRSSRAQLELDFGHFPPAPLRCKDLKGSWNLVRVAGIGQTYQDLRVFRALMKAVGKDDQGAVDRDISSNEEYQAARRVAGELAKVRRLLVGVLWLTPILLAVRSYFSKTPAVHSRDGVGGYFNALLPDHIVIRETGGKLGDAAVVSHEHVHLLQHHDGETHSRALQSPSTFLSDKALTVPQLQYFFEKREVEARLHECVLSCYRAWGHLPLVVSELMSLLASSQSLGWLVSGVLSEDPSSPNVPPQQPYVEREPEFAGQLEMILLSMRTPELQRRFITEVLPVMYANLLRYYGDSAASEHFLSQVDRPNLYDDLYGAPRADDQASAPGAKLSAR
jgi:hypothetical protein